MTCAARDTEHAEQLVEAMRSVAGVVIGKVSDRTFLMHLGGKIAMMSKHPIRNRDDLSMIYTPVWHEYVWRSPRIPRTPAG